LACPHTEASDGLPQRHSCAHRQGRKRGIRGGGGRGIRTSRSLGLRSGWAMSVLVPFHAVPLAAFYHHAAPRWKDFPPECRYLNFRVELWWVLQRGPGLVARGGCAGLPCGTHATATLRAGEFVSLRGPEYPVPRPHIRGAAPLRDGGRRETQRECARSAL